MANGTTTRLLAVNSDGTPRYLSLSITGTTLKISDDSGNNLGLEIGAFYITPEGGYAVKMVAGETLVKGNIVGIRQTGGTDGRVWKSGNTSTPVDMPVGIAYSAANAGADVWIVTTGKVEVLPLSTITAVRGDVLFAGAENGRADQSATVPSSDHWKECGHWINSGSGAGIATLAIVHFN